MQCKLQMQLHQSIDQRKLNKWLAEVA